MKNDDIEKIGLEHLIMVCRETIKLSHAALSEDALFQDIDAFEASLEDMESMCDILDPEKKFKYEMKENGDK